MCARASSLAESMLISLTECGSTVPWEYWPAVAVSPYYRTGPTLRKPEVPASGTPIVNYVYSLVPTLVLPYYLSWYRYVCVFLVVVRR